MSRKEWDEFYRWNKWKEKEFHRNRIKAGMSEVFRILGFEDAEKNVWRVQTKEQFKYYVSIARGYFRAMRDAGKISKEKANEGIKLVNQLERDF